MYMSSETASTNVNELLTRCSVRTLFWSIAHTHVHTHTPMFFLFYKDHKQAVFVLVNIVLDKRYNNDRVANGHRNGYSSSDKILFYNCLRIMYYII